MATIGKKIKKWFGIKDPQSGNSFDTAKENKSLNKKVNSEKKELSNSGKGDKGVKKADPPVNENEDSEKKNAGIKKKKQKEIDLICNNCLHWFTSGRKDTKYCSKSCKQNAWVLGYDRWRYSNVGEHIFVEAINNIIVDIQECDHSIVTKEELDRWLNIIEFLIGLYKNFLQKDNYYLKFAQNNLLIFIGLMQKQFAEDGKKQKMTLLIPPEYSKAWRKFEEAIDFDKPKEPEVIIFGGRIPKP